MNVRVLAPCRLHFGLLHVPAAAAGAAPLAPYGGLGLMIDEPFVSVIVEPATTTSVTGSLAGRATKFLEILAPATPVTVTADGPPEHVGLGVGTALGLSLAKALTIITGEGDVSIVELARRAQRGKRSRIGLAGFEFGGFLFHSGYEAGKYPESFRYPANWRIVALRPPVEPRWHGPLEEQAFASPRSPAEALATSAKLAKLIETRILHSLIAREFQPFAAALGEYNLIAGEPFRAAQGGPHCDPRVTELIDWLKAAGHAGAGQSSWGPTVFFLAASEEEATAAIAEMRKQFPDVPVTSLTAAANVGAMVQIN